MENFEKHTNKRNQISRKNNVYILKILKNN